MVGGSQGSDHLYTIDCLNVDFNEFLGMMKSKASEADQESDLREAFKIFDKDKNGYIDMKELKQVREGYKHFRTFLVFLN